MYTWPSDYVEYVLDEIKKYQGRPQVVKASLLERLSTKKAKTASLHPNPDDEFSIESIGPNMSIVSDYEREIRKLQKIDKPIYSEPVVVEKLRTGGYLLLNGHHRWFAAMRMRVKKIQIKIVNLVHEEDLTRMMAGTTNTKRATFDLDEVLLALNGKKAEELSGSLPGDKVPLRLREGAQSVIRTLCEKGYDIWIYTADYYSEGQIALLFEMYDLRITGAVNGINRKKSDSMKAALEKMNQQYRETIHIDDASVLVTHADSKDFTQYDLEDPADWSGSVLKILKQR